MSYIYNNYKPSIRQRVGSFLGGLGEGRGRKDAAFPAEPYQVTQLPVTWSGGAPNQVIRNHFKGNSAVLACVGVWASSFTEASLKMYDRKTQKEIPGHPLTTFMEAPNELMGQDEWWAYVVTYILLGGNSYGHKVRSKAHFVAELWPYHFGKFLPVPAGNKWIDHFAYNLGNGTYKMVPTKDVIHVKWIIPGDPDKPWIGLNPLAGIAKEIDTDNELTRLTKAVLENDAIPRAVLSAEKGVMIDEKKGRQIELDWERKYGGDRRGHVAVLTGGLNYQRISLSFAELEAGSLRNVDEARIAGDLLVPPQLAHLNVGMEHSIYNNWTAAQEAFTYRALIPMWKRVAAEYQSSLVPEFDDPSRVMCAFDLSGVEVLKRKRADLVKQVLDAGYKGFLTVNEVRAEYGYPAIEGGDILKPAPANVGIALDGQALGGPPPAKSLWQGFDEGMLALPDGGALAVVGK
jgi:HK97 family phage portal protein